MPQLPSRKRYLLIGTAAAVLVISGALLRQFLFAPPATVGDFSIPFLPGWGREVAEGKNAQSVFFNRGTTTMRVMWLKPRQRSQPKTASDLVAIYKKGLVARMGRPEKLKERWKLVSTSGRPLVLHGMTAFLAEEKFSGEQAGSTKSLSLIKGNRYYILSSYLKSNADRAAEASALADRDAAWQKLIDSLKK
ncbi:hypothetical protein EON80_06540 [bacterium]|nr:MAG: hypothetical protein EON80_06540 [bacterium]